MAADTPKRTSVSWHALGGDSLQVAGNDEPTVWSRLTSHDRSLATDSLTVLRSLASQGPVTFASSMLSVLRAPLLDDVPSHVESLALDASSVDIEVRRMAWDMLRMFFVEQGEVNLTEWHARACGAFLDSDASTAARYLARDVPSLRSHAQPELTSPFWPAIATLAAVGLTQSAADVLGLHSSWRHADGPSDALEAVALLLRQRPRDDALPNAKAQWTNEARRLLDATDVWATCRHSSDVGGLQILLLVLAGDDATLSSVTGTWVELLIARIVHARSPARSLPSRLQLRQLAESCVAEKPPSEEDSTLALAYELLVCCCDNDAPGAVRACSHDESLGPWFLAHALEMLPSGSDHLPNLGCDQREYYRLQYACALLPHIATRPVALRYLAMCPTYGPCVLDAVVERLGSNGGDGEHLDVLPTILLAENLGLKRASAAATSRLM
ncbi:nuclear pore complex protein Nup85 [Pseudoscourfieldia marina]